MRTVGGADPCLRRFGILRADNDVVVVPDINALRRRQEEQERARNAPLEEARQKWSGARGDWRTGDPDRKPAEIAITRCIEAVRHDPDSFKEQARKARYVANLCDADPDLIYGDLITAAAEARVDQCIAEVRRAISGARHPTYLQESARALAICTKYALDWPPVRKRLQDTNVATLSPQEAEQRRRTSTESVLHWLEERNGS